MTSSIEIIIVGLQRIDHTTVPQIIKQFLHFLAHIVTTRRVLPRHSLNEALRAFTSHTRMQSAHTHPAITVSTGFRESEAKMLTRLAFQPSLSLARAGYRRQAFEAMKSPALRRGGGMARVALSSSAGRENSPRSIADAPDTEDSTGVVRRGNVKRSNGTNVADDSWGEFSVIKERKIFNRYQTVWERKVRYPNGQVVSYDVLGNERSCFQSVFVMPFNTRTRTATTIREYSPGKGGAQLSFVAGMFEGGKHASLEDAARAELSEEAHLRGGTLIPLTPAASGGICADKYSRNMFHYFLCVDCETDDAPKTPDAEEWIEIMEGVRLTRVRELIMAGEFNTPSSLLGLLALDKLREMGFAEE